MFFSLLPSFSALLMARAPVAAHVGGALSVVRMSVGGEHTHENLHHINVPSMPPEEEMPSRKHRRKPGPAGALGVSPQVMETVVNGLGSHTHDELHHRNVPKMPPAAVPAAVEGTGGQPARSPPAMETVVNGLGAHTHDQLHHINVPSADR